MVTTKKNLRKAIKEDVKHVLEDSYDLSPEDIPCSIFSIEAKQRTHMLLALSKDELHKLSHETQNGDSAHLGLVDTGRIRNLLHYKKHLLDQRLQPGDGSFRHASITLHDLMHLENILMT